jgi:hypothetical protein
MVTMIIGWPRARTMDLIELRPGEVRVEHPEKNWRRRTGRSPGRTARRDVLHQLGHQRDQEQLRHTHPHDHLADLQGVVVLDLRQIQRHR